MTESKFLGLNLPREAYVRTELSLKPDRCAMSWYVYLNLWNFFPMFRLVRDMICTIIQPTVYIVNRILENFGWGF